MGDNVAVMQGYTKQVCANSEDGMYTLFLLVKPDYDPDEQFKAWDTDEQEFLSINGWNWTFEDDDLSGNDDEDAAMLAVDAVTEQAGEGSWEDDEKPRYGSQQWAETYSDDSGESFD